jgi:ABC-type multidrug transport system fused ATPase/permease subunit
MPARSPLVRLLAFLKPYRGWIEGGIIVALLASAAALAVPWFGRRALDQILTTRAPGDVNEALIFLGALWLSAVGLNFARDVIAAHTGHRVIADIRQYLVAHTLRLPVAYFDRARLGDLMSRLTTDTEQLRRALSEDLIRAVGDVAMLTGGAVLLLALDWRLTIALLALAVVVPVGHRWLSPRVRMLNRIALDVMSSALARVSEAFSNLRLVKSFGREQHEASITAHDLTAVFEAATRASRFESFAWTGVYALFGLVALGVIAYGVHRVLLEELSVGAMIAYFYTLMIVAGPLTSVAGAAGRVQRARAAADRVCELMDEPPEQDETGSQTNLRVTRGEIQFAEVGFSYQPGETVLSDFTLHVPAGMTVALVGPTGAGKSTVFALLQRFYEPTTGKILIDGVPVSTVSRRSLREAFALVPQEALLFNGTIRENIRYGRLDASAADIERAAAAAHVTDFAARLDAGLETVVGERGIRLSGGQRQLVGIARAILRDAPILLLDEATSSLDAHFEALVRDALRALMAGRTTLVIAHQVETAENADLIAVLDSGRVVAVGSPRELKTSSEHYKHLFAHTLDGYLAGCSAGDR